MDSWILTLTFIFGGCCANAVTLEQLTSVYPFSGSLITFVQFLLISFHGLPKHIQFVPSTRWRIPIPHLKPRKIPISPYLIQVTLFYLISLLNNAAFGYQIPMAVHIIFRSCGLIVSMLLGWTVASKRYNITQIISVLLVTLGVVLTTLSASKPDTKHALYAEAPHNVYIYTMGIAILSLALLLSGFLGMVQDKTCAMYVRPHTASGIISQNVADEDSKQKNAVSEVPAWQESMFYLHFLALPMFFFVRHDLLDQIKSVSAGPRIYITVPYVLQSSPSPSIASVPPHSPYLAVSFPQTVLPLLLNTIAQLVCVSGVHRLTTRVSSLTVTLILVVRKAVSFVLSVLWLRGGGGETRLVMMWVGAALVMLGTVGYSVGNGSAAKAAVKEEKGKKA